MKNRVSAVPICKNCKWAKPVNNWHIWWIPIIGWIFFLLEFSERWANARCKRISNIDLVSGSPVYMNVDCRSYRDRDYQKDVCGPEGKYFEAKNKTNEAENTTSTL